MQVDHAERINGDLRTELRALREEAAAAQERVMAPIPATFGVILEF